MTAGFALTGLALLLESIEKKRPLVSNEKARTPEQSSGFWTRTCFSWLAATFWAGYSKVISVDDLPALDEKLESSILGTKLMSTWDKCEYIPLTLFQVISDL